MTQKFGRTAIILLLSAFLTIFAVAAIYKLVVKKSECTFSDEDLKDNRFHASIRGQSIDVVGWYHGTTERVSLPDNSGQF